ncbi:ATP-binding protein [Bacillus sp. B15-48]|uniref:sensor histidine kinase n=1 Tax=Bacillus sp. B15-48 TaxID=1548601 RepID=UPI00193F1AE2|nr:ATP-binding protein [Bacillus sp. B15-48]MBM4763231.1 HAMP domain-containing protein [Bacillus sp. B15-48]
MKLQHKLIFAFILIVFSMGAVQAFILKGSIEDTFETYIDKSHFGLLERMKQSLENYYEQTGSWDNVQQVLFEANLSSGQGWRMTDNDNQVPVMPDGSGQGMGGMHGRGGMNSGIGFGMSAMMTSADLLLLDKEGTVIADSTQTRIGEDGEDFRGQAVELIVGGEHQGTLVLQQNGWQTLEEEFIQTSNRAIVISSLIAAGLALFISFWIARTITNPLRKLMTATKQLARGQKVSEVKIRTKDEFYELGAAFNDMARKLARNEEARQALVADVAHELRTPLAIFQGKLEAIQEGAIEPSEEVILELTDEVYRLNRLVSDLQQISLAEAGTLPLTKKQTNISELIQRVCASLQWMAEEKNITLSCEQLPEECLLEIDRDRMTQVMVNLTGNALRHTEENGVVEMTLTETDASCTVIVRDNGPGISEDVLPFIFERFYKGDPSRSRKESGTGLGLSIAKGFVEAHGGKMEARSKVGQGSTFILTLFK